MDLTCCVTGHRRILDEKLDYVRAALRREIELAIGDGYTTFISGFADGTDLEFAAIIAEIKKDNPAIFLEAAIPYPDRMKTKNEQFHKLIKQCDGMKFVSDGYGPSCYFMRNRYLITRSQRVIAVFDGRERSGTAQTMRMAATAQRELRTISI